MWGCEGICNLLMPGFGFLSSIAAWDFCKQPLRPAIVSVEQFTLSLSRLVLIFCGVWCQTLFFEFFWFLPMLLWLFISLLSLLSTFAFYSVCTAPCLPDIFLLFFSF